MGAEWQTRSTHPNGLDDWYAGPFGQRFAAAECDALSRVLATLFGYHALCLDVGGPVDWLAASRIRHHCRLAVSARMCPGTSVMTAAEAWPVQADVVDLVVLPHVLESVASPERVLVELERVLIPEGHAVILGFNPLLDGGLWRLLRPRSSALPAGVHPLGPALVRGWLRRHGFVAEALSFHAHWPWCVQGWLRPGKQSVPALCACGYLLLARKRVSMLTPIKPRWRPRRRLIPVAAEGRLLHFKSEP